MAAVLTTDGHGDVGKACKPVNLNVLEVDVPYFKAEADHSVLPPKM